MDNENKQQQINEENNYYNSSATATIDSLSTQFNEKVN